MPHHNKILDFENNILTLIVPSNFSKNWIHEKYEQLILNLPLNSIKTDFIINYNDILDLNAQLHANISIDYNYTKLKFLSEPRLCQKAWSRAALCVAGSVVLQLNDQA